MAQSLEGDIYTDATASAEAVMDELFGDVEKKLHIDKASSVTRPTPPAVEFDPLEPEEDVMWLSPYSPPPEPPEQSSPPAPPDHNWLTPLLLICACGSALLATILWSFHLTSKLAQLQQPTPTTAVHPDSNKPTSRFSDEIRDLLASTASTPTVASLPTPTPELPPPPAISAPPPVPQTIYVPVYQPPTTALAPVETTSPTNSEPSPAPAPSYTLVGVLNFGDRATAMFESNGIVETVSVGNSIGNTGWTLSKVQQRDVILKRNNETKTVLVGQKF